MENAGINFDISEGGEEKNQSLKNQPKLKIGVAFQPKERFRTYTLSEEFVEEQFEKYKKHHSDEDERTQRENYQKTLDGIFQNKSRRVGAKVFCICCGAGKRSPLRKWKNVYICSDCWKIKERIGEEKFMKALKGEE